MPLDNLAKVLLWVVGFSRHHLKLCINHTNKYIRNISIGICRGPKLVLSSVQGELPRLQGDGDGEDSSGIYKISSWGLYPRLDILENQSGIYEKSTR